MTEGTITEFLLARIAEDADRAEHALQHFPSEPSWWHFTESILTNEGSNQQLGRAFRHIDRCSPARILAECAAKRAIIDGWEDPEVDGPWVTDADAGHVLATDKAVRALAAVYRDHPDYRQEWAA